MIKKKLNNGRDFSAYLLLAPAGILMLGLVLYPILVTFGYSLQRMKLTAPDETKWVGFDNYREMLNSNDFTVSLQNTAIIVVLVVFFCVLCGLILSVMLNVNTPIRGLLTAIAILPWALPPVVNGILWKWIFHSGYGFINKILISLHLIDIPIEWLSGRGTLLVVIAIVAAWRNVPFCTVVYLSAMQGIPSAILEAVDIDGATAWQRFRYVTFPLLLPATGIVLTSTSISAINIFDEIISLSGYSNLGKTLLIHDYLVTFSFLDFGMGSALSYIIMLLAGILGIFYIHSARRKVSYL